MSVVDASVLATALADDGPDGARLRDLLRDSELLAPELVDLELASAWRRAVRVGTLRPTRAIQALADLAEIPLIRARHQPLLPRVWELRENLSAYDASYAALAEAVEQPLLTADRGLARAPGIRCQVEFVE